MRLGTAAILLAGLVSCGDEVPDGSDDRTDPSPADTLRASLQAVRPGETVLLPSRGLWHVWDKGGALPPAWRTDPRAVGSWKGMTSPLGYGESYVNPIEFGPDSSRKHVTSYFQTSFTVVDPSIVVALRLELMYDDGVVVYLNGHEMGRASMPSGPVGASTLALNHEAGNAYRSFDVSSQIPHLRNGINQFAVEVHQASRSSSDLVFDAALYAEYDSASGIPAVSGGILPESHWSYWDGGDDLGTAWRTPGYDDHLWKTGRAILGYGEDEVRTPVSYGPDPAAKHVTTYFRKKFLVEDPSAVSAMVAGLKNDDGIVVYLNGTEIERRSMPAGPVSSGTLALDHEADEFFDSASWTAHLPLLMPGTNTLAVEVHQASSASSDLVFDLRLEIRTNRIVTRLLVPRGSEWSFHDVGPVDPDWKGRREPPLPQHGLAPLGYGESYLQTRLSFGSDPANKPVTAYFKRDIDHGLGPIPDEEVKSVRLRVRYDDGFVAYLTGREILRVSMPPGPVNADTRAFDHEATSYEEFNLDGIIPYLDGAVGNSLQFEIHQASPGSSDLVFDAELEITRVE